MLSVETLLCRIASTRVLSWEQLPPKLVKYLFQNPTILSLPVLEALSCDPELVENLLASPLIMVSQLSPSELYR